MHYLVKCPSAPYENTDCFGDLDRAWGLCLDLSEEHGYAEVVYYNLWTLATIGSVTPMANSRNTYCTLLVGCYEYKGRGALMSYDFQALAEQCQDDTWVFYPEVRIWDIAVMMPRLSIGRIGWLYLSEVEEAGVYDSIEGWEHEEYWIDWECDELREDICRIAKYQSNPL